MNLYVSWKLRSFFSIGILFTLVWEKNYIYVFFVYFQIGLKFHFGLIDRNEIRPVWNFISANTCIHHREFVQRPKWTQTGLNFKPVWNFTCNHPLRYILFFYVKSTSNWNNIYIYKLTWIELICIISSFLFIFKIFKKS